MGLFNRLFGFRWSLYVVKNDNQLLYAMHANSVMGMVGYVMTSFRDGQEPVEPWSLFLNFNHKHKLIKLAPHHFKDNGDNVSARLISEIEAIDKNWRVKYQEPVFEDALTKMRLKISSSNGAIDMNALFEQAKAELSGKPKDVTFFSVLDKVFGRV
jgi:hypothetical protein